MLGPFAVPPSPLQRHPDLSNAHHTLLTVHMKATSKQVTRACVLGFGDGVFQHKWVTGALEGRENLKQTSLEMLLRVGTSEAFTVFTDTALRGIAAALGLRRLACCSESKRKDIILQYQHL